jgi:hypothetical protein
VPWLPQPPGRARVPCVSGPRLVAERLVLHSCETGRIRGRVGLVARGSGLLHADMGSPCVPFTPPRPWLCMLVTPGASVARAVGPGRAGLRQGGGVAAPRPEKLCRSQQGWLLTLPTPMPNPVRWPLVLLIDLGSDAGAVRACAGPGQARGGPERQSPCEHPSWSRRDRRRRPWSSCPPPASSRSGTGRHRPARQGSRGAGRRGGRGHVPRIQVAGRVG